MKPFKQILSKYRLSVITTIILCWMSSLFAKEVFAQTTDQNQPLLQQPPSSTVNTSNNFCTNDNYTFKSGALILNNNQHVSHIFQIQNISQGLVMINTADVSDPGAGAGWASQIDAGNYSLITMNQNNFTLKCIISNPPVEMGAIDCQRVLKVCSMTPRQPLGSFWIVENKNLMEIFKTLTQRRLVE